MMHEQKVNSEIDQYLSSLGFAREDDALAKDLTGKFSLMAKYAARDELRVYVEDTRWIFIFEFEGVDKEMHGDGIERARFIEDYMAKFPTHCRWSALCNEPGSKWVMTPKGKRRVFVCKTHFKDEQHRRVCVECGVYIPWADEQQARAGDPEDFVCSFECNQNWYAYAQTCGGCGKRTSKTKCPRCGADPVTEPELPRAPLTSEEEEALAKRMERLTEDGVLGFPDNLDEL